MTAHCQSTLCVRVLTIAIFLVLVPLALSQDKTSQKAKKDIHGDPLPEHAIARMGSLRFTSNTGLVALEFLEGGKKLRAWNGGKKAYLYDIGSGKPPIPTKPPEIKMPQGALGEFGGSNNLTSTPLVTADGKKKIVLGRKQVKVVDIKTKRVLHKLPGAMLAVTSPDSKTLAMLEVTILIDDPINPKCKQELAIWDLKMGKRLRKLNQAPGKITFPHSFLANDALLVVSHQQGKEGRLMSSDFYATSASIVDPKTGKPKVTFRWKKTDKVLPAPIFTKTLVGFQTTRDVLLYNEKTGKLVKRLNVLNKQRATPYATTAISPNGRWLAVVARQKCLVWELPKGRLAWTSQLPATWELQPYSEAHFSPNSKVLAIANSQVFFWDVKTGKKLSPWLGHQSNIKGIVSSPDGKTLMTASHDGVIGFWETKTCKVLDHIIAHEGGVFQLAITRDGKRLASTGRDGEVKLWDVQSKRLLKTMFGPKKHAFCIAFTPEDKTLAVGLHKSLHLLDAKTGKHIGKIEGTATYPDNIAFSANGKWMAVGGGPIQLWDWQAKLLTKKLPGRAGKLVFSPDSRWLASVGAYGKLWEVATGLHLSTTYQNRTCDLDFFPNSRDLAGAYIYERDNQRQLALSDRAQGFGWNRGLPSTKASPEIVRVLPQGNRVAVGYRNGTVLVWDVSKTRKDRLRVYWNRPIEEQWERLRQQETLSWAHESVWELISFPKKSLPVLEKHLRPVKAVDLKLLPKLLQELNSEKFRVRAKATKRLEAYNEHAIPFLRKELAKSHPLEIQIRLRKLLQKALRIPPKELQVLRAIEVLEHINTKRSKRILQSLAKGAPSSRITLAASGR